MVARLPRFLLPICVVCLAPASVPAQGGLDLTVARFWRAPDTTLVAGACRLPLPLFDLVHTGPAGWAAYRMTVSLRDSTGRELHRDSWIRTLPRAILENPPPQAAFAFFRLALRPGRHRLRVTVTDSATGRTVEVDTTLDAFAGAPVLSDLLLAATSRVAAGAGDTVPRPGELLWDGVFLGEAGRPDLADEARGRVAYFAEVYAAAGTATFALALLDPRNQPRAAADPRVRDAPAARPILLGALSLLALPPGGYRVRLTARAGTDTVVRDAPFAIRAAGPASPETAAASGTRFDDAAEALLDSLYAPLVYLMRSDERGAYSGLAVAGKRDYLRRFWERRDPTPGTPRNEAQEDFYDRIRVANREFREGGAAQIPGWRTDRGRIFIRNGPPDDVLRQPQPDYSVPYEAWKYTRGRRLKFVFGDLTRFGNYTLLYTDDIHEVGRPGWWDLLGSRATEDVLRF